MAVIAPSTVTTVHLVVNLPEWDSLAHMTLIEEIESSHGILMAPADIAELMSLADAINIVICETAKSGN